MSSNPLISLNPEQREVALHRGNCLAIACPGSGKTKTLSSKAALFLQEGARVAAVTFTRDAALELRERIVKGAGPGSQSRLLVGTFHSIDLLMAFPKRPKSEFGNAILKDMRSPFTAPWQVVKEGLRRNYLLRAMEESGTGVFPFEKASRIIEEAKGSRSTANLEAPHAAMVEIYADLLASNGVIDFQDIILKTNDALRAGTLSTLPVDYLLVDEFQDTDAAQFEWVGHHAKAKVAVTAVGDDDQSIYAFRRALGYGGLERFAQGFNGHRVMLGTNYRCRSEILGAAERLISKNAERIAKRLYADKGAGGTVEWKTYKSAVDEAKAASTHAQAAIDAGASFAVIARTNRQLDVVVSELIFDKIPYRRAEGASIFSYPEVQVYGALLRTLISAERSDIDQVLSWAGMNESDLKEVRRLFGNAIRVGATTDFSNSTVSDHGKEVWKSFAKRHAQWANLKLQKLYTLLNAGVREWLLDHIRKPYRADRIELSHQVYDVRDESLELRLKALADAERSERESDADPKAISLLTAHGSKGLEYDRVLIIGLEEGVFPNEDSSLEEERRLMFVAMTRAREKLWISASDAKKRSIFVPEAGLCE